MNLNLPPPDSNMEGGGQPHNTVGSIHPPSNYENVVEQFTEDQRIPNKMPEWLVQLTSNNPHKALEQFQKLKSPGRIRPN